MQKLTRVSAMYPRTLLLGSFSGMQACSQWCVASCMICACGHGGRRPDLFLLSNYLKAGCNEQSSSCKCLPSPRGEGQTAVAGRSSPLCTPHLPFPSAHSSSASQLPPSLVCRPVPPYSAALALAWALGTASQRCLSVGDWRLSKNANHRIGCSDGSDQNEDPIKSNTCLPGWEKLVYLAAHSSRSLLRHSPSA